MKININYFASLRETIGKGEITLESSETTLTAAQVWTLSTGKTSFPDKILIAVNNEYVDLETKVVDGDHVSFFPPVTGG